jgi:DNA-binding XRE family transcriptional regulator
MVHNNLSIILEHRDITSRWLANAVNVSEGYMSKIISQKQTPSPELMFEIADQLELSLTDIWYYTKDHKGVPVDGS